MCPCHALHENTLGWLIFGEMVHVESFHTCCWGFSRIHALCACGAVHFELKSDAQELQGIPLSGASSTEKTESLLAVAQPIGPWQPGPPVARQSVDRTVIDHE